VWLLPAYNRTTGNAGRYFLCGKFPANRGGCGVQLVSLVGRGATNREVAERLYLSPYTVNSHLRHVFTKLGIRSRVELAHLATTRGLPAEGS
jgi:DNA-binding CsgD family transcriptional regulator